MHAALARPAGMFHFTTPLTVAETASVFGETIVSSGCSERTGPAARLALLAESLDGAVAAVFRQIAMNRFEDRVHTRARASRASCRSSASSRPGSRRQTELLGDSVELTDGYGSWWSYIPHFVDTPGYVYAYAYGNLLALSVYRRYEEEGDGLRAAYLDLLRAGGSCCPRSSARSSASTSPTPASGTPAST